MPVAPTVSPGLSLSHSFAQRWYYFRRYSDKRYDSFYHSQATWQRFPAYWWRAGLLIKALRSQEARASEPLAFAWLRRFPCRLAAVVFHGESRCAALNKLLFPSLPFHCRSCCWRRSAVVKRYGILKHNWKSSVDFDSTDSIFAVPAGIQSNAISWTNTVPDTRHWYLSAFCPASDHVRILPVESLSSDLFFHCPQAGRFVLRVKKHYHKEMS